MNYLDLDIAIQEDIEVKLSEDIILKIFGNSITLELYIKMIKFYKSIEKCKTDLEQINKIITFVKEIINQGVSNKEIPSFILNDIDYMSAIMTIIVEYYNEIESNKILHMPNLDDNNKKNSNSSSNDEIEIMENIAYFMKQTRMSYFDTLKLPYSSFLSLMKHFRMMELVQIPEYRDKILKARNIKGRTKPDMNALKALGMKQVKV